MACPLVNARYPASRRCSQMPGREPSTRVQTIVIGQVGRRVADVAATHKQWSARGTQFLTRPIDRGGEIR